MFLFQEKTKHANHKCFYCFSPRSRRMCTNTIHQAPPQLDHRLAKWCWWQKRRHFLDALLLGPGLFTSSSIPLRHRTTPSATDHDTAQTRPILPPRIIATWAWPGIRGPCVSPRPDRDPTLPAILRGHWSSPITLPSWAGSGSGVSEMSLSSRRHSQSPSTDTRKLQR